MRLATVLDEALAHPRFRNLQSLIVVRDDEIVVERYFRDRRPHDLSNCHSVTKSFLSALTGIAIRDGAMKLTTSLGEVFDVGGAKADITVEQLLTMTSGLAADGAYDIDEIADRGDSWIEGPLRAPLRTKPGSAFAYNNGAAHVLSALVATSVQASLTEFAEARLFSPLGIDDYRWPRDPGGNPFGYGHLEVRPRDLVSLGRLFLARGDVRGRRVLDPAYVDRATRASTAGGPPEGTAYGYLWWVSELAGMSTYFAAGYGGQYLVVVPHLDVVAVTTADVDVLIPSSSSPLRLLTEVILPAVAPVETRASKT